LQLTGSAIHSRRRRPLFCVIIGCSRNPNGSLPRRTPKAGSTGRGPALREKQPWRNCVWGRLESASPIQSQRFAALRTAKGWKYGCGRGPIALLIVVGTPRLEAKHGAKRVADHRGTGGCKLLIFRVTSMFARDKMIEESHWENAHAQDYWNYVVGVCLLTHSLGPEYCSRTARSDDGPLLRP
jgi:hypothetical protein